MPGWRNLAATIVGIIKGPVVYNRKIEICLEVAVLVEVFCNSGALILLNVRAVRLVVL